MDPITLAALMGGVSFLNAETTGKEDQRRQAELKAANYRASPYTSAANPDAVQIVKPNPLGSAVSGAGAGYQFGQNAQDSASLRNYFNSKAVQSVGPSEYQRLQDSGGLSATPIGASSYQDFANQTNSPYSQVRRSPWGLGY